MSGTQPKFTLVEEQPDTSAKASAQMLGLALRALSQRSLAGISDLFSLILVGAVWALAYHVLDAPSQMQIITLFGFAAFAITIDTIRRRHK